MFQIAQLPLQRLEEPRSQGDEVALEALKVLLRGISRENREVILAQLLEELRPIQAPRAGDVLGAILKFLPRKTEWTVGDVKAEVSTTGVPASPKDIYNAMAYLTRTGQVQRVGYGRYVVGGVGIPTSDDFGGPTTRHEDSYRTSED